MITEERPWGRYTIILTKDNFQVKQLEVLPGKRLSLQSHRFRSEHWFVVNGSGAAQVGDLNTPITLGQSVDVEVGVKHRISNTSDQLLVLIEIQTGTSFDESDIQRYEDDYGR